MHGEWYCICDFVVLSVLEVCADYGGVNVFHVCLNFGVVYGVGVCVIVCGVVCIVVCCLFLTSVCCLLCCVSRGSASRGIPAENTEKRWRHLRALRYARVDYPCL